MPAELVATVEAEVLDEHGPDVGQVAGRGVHRLDDAGPADGHPADVGRQAAVVVAAGDLTTGDVPAVSDHAWEWMEPLLPSSTGRRGGRYRDHRQMVDAICWKYRTGSPWRDLPERFGPWQTAYGRLARWSADGTWATLLARAQTEADAAGELDWLVAVGSSVVGVHQPGSSARRIGGFPTTGRPDDSQDTAAA